MEQRGLPWREDDPCWARCRAEVEEAVEGALIDIDYCLDAPRYIPAGACYRIPCYEEFAAPVQFKTIRHP